MKTGLLHRLLTRLFPLEEINGRNLCPTYLYRWTLFKRWQRGIYLHKFVGEDWCLDLHDHPRRFISIGLWGGYVEHTPNAARRVLGGDPAIFDCGCSRVKVDLGRCSIYSDPQRAYRAPWVRTFSAEHTHRLTGPTPERPCWTLIVVLKPTREWGFWSAGRWVNWRHYVASATAEERKACP